MTIPSIPDPGTGVSVAFGIRTKLFAPQGHERLQHWRTHFPDVFLSSR